jgi:hypothetical protein
MAGKTGSTPIYEKPVSSTDVRVPHSRAGSGGQRFPHSQVFRQFADVRELGTTNYAVFVPVRRCTTKEMTANNSRR